MVLEMIYHSDVATYGASLNLATYSASCASHGSGYDEATEETLPIAT